MNRTYDNNFSESNCKPVKLKSADTENDSLLDAIGSKLMKLTSAKVLALVRAIVAVLCFFGFVGVLGGVEAETLNIGTAIVMSAFLLFIEILCLVPHNKK